MPETCDPMLASVVALPEYGDARPTRFEIVPTKSVDDGVNTALNGLVTFVLTAGAAVYGGL
jgi:hypothetical protein